MTPAPIGARFGRLTVIAEGRRRQSPCGVHVRLVLVACTCGTVQLARLPNLVSGNTTSCGCRVGELNRQRTRPVAG